MGLATENLRQNSENNLMDASIDLEDLIEAVLDEDKATDQLYEKQFAVQNDLVKTSRRDKHGRMIYKAPKTTRVKINIKDVDEMREEIKLVLKGERDNVNISKKIAKKACNHLVTFIDENPQDGKKGTLVRQILVEDQKAYNQKEWYECPHLQNEHVEATVSRQIEDMVLVNDSSDGKEEPKSQLSGGTLGIREKKMKQKKDITCCTGCAVF